MVRAAAAAGLLLSSCAATFGQDADEIVDALGRPGTEVFLAENLAADTDPARRMVVQGKCEGAGERELRSLARRAELEEAFAFLPDHCLWVEIGLDQTSSSVRLERGIIDELVERFRRVTIYHIHPASFDSAGHFPAYSDLIGSILINGRYLRDLDVEIGHRAVTPYGTFHYGFEASDRGLQLIEVIFNTGLGAFAGENLVIGYADPEHEAQYYAAIQRCSAAGSATAAACFPMRASDFVLDFRRHDDVEAVHSVAQ
jgi:hypothetical protein